MVPALCHGEAAATHGRGSIVEHAWRRYLEAGPQLLLPLLVAAGREPRIRSLMPYQTTRGMLFHRTVGYPPSADNISVVVVDGGYRVEDWNGADLGTADADGAVALMLDALRARSA
ncbi:DUF6193 family natural product biosynthesis protein [Dactylosporangium cerinum]